MEMIKLVTKNREILFIIIKGVLSGVFWQLEFFIFDIPIIYYGNDTIIILYCIVVSFIYFYLLKSQNKYQTMTSWLISLPISFITWRILLSSPLYEFVYKYSRQNLWNVI